MWTCNSIARQRVCVKAVCMHLLLCIAFVSVAYYTFSSQVCGGSFIACQHIVQESVFIVCMRTSVGGVRGADVVVVGGLLGRTVARRVYHTTRAKYSHVDIMMCSVVHACVYDKYTHYLDNERTVSLLTGIVAVNCADLSLIQIHS